jgi:flagellar motor switch protein FliG
MAGWIICRAAILLVPLGKEKAWEILKDRD